jgi:nitrogen fixation protein NifU and related proteins
MEPEDEEQRVIIEQLRGDGYSDTAIDHWLHPRNFGQISDYSGFSGKHTGPCGDSMWIWIGVVSDTIRRTAYVGDVCIGTITAGSMLTEMVKGMSVGSALAIERDDVLERLGGLPPQYLHCAELATKTLRLAIMDYNRYRSSPWKRTYERH